MKKIRVRKRHTWFKISLVMVVLLLIAERYYFEYQIKEQEKIVNISVIVYGNDSERWENLKQGAEQAAEDLSAEVSFITMSDDFGIKEQISLIEREIGNGADAIMIAACDSEKMQSYLDQGMNKVPLVMIETGLISNSEIPFVSANNYQMGIDLADTMMVKEKERAKVAVIHDDLQRDSVIERYQGFTDTIDNKMDNLVIWERNDNEKSIETMLFLQRELTEEAVDIVVALDNSSLEAIVDAVTNLNKKVRIYGIANTDKAVFYLDNGTIEALMYQNEFSIGYLGVQELLGKKDYQQEELQNLVEYRVVEKENMYSINNQKMLFPFVK